KRLGQVPECGVGPLDRRPEEPHRLAKARLYRCEARHRDVEVREEVLELLLVLVERREDLVEAGNQLAEVVRLRAEERGVDDRAVLERAGRVVERLVERDRGGLAAHGRILTEVVGGRWAARECRAEALQAVLQV